MDFPVSLPVVSDLLLLFADFSPYFFTEVNQDSGSMVVCILGSSSSFLNSRVVLGTLY